MLREQSASTAPFNCPRAFSEHHQDLLGARGITLDTATKARLVTVSKHETPDLLGYEASSGLWIPYNYGAGGYYGRLRVDNPAPDAPRYMAPKGPVWPYIPHESVLPALALGDTTVTLHITEAPLKALSLCQEQLFAIGLGGVDAGGLDAELWKNRGQLALHPLLLEKVQCKGRRVVLVFDAGRAKNPSVAYAEAKLATAFRTAGAEVYLAELPLTEEGKDQGPDDYKKANGVEALKEIIQRAVKSHPQERLRECAANGEPVNELLDSLPWLAALQTISVLELTAIRKALYECGVPARELTKARTSFSRALQQKAEHSRRKKERPAQEETTSAHLTTKEYNPTDVGNGQRMAALHRDKLRYVSGLGWVVWDGKRWTPDTKCQVDRCAQETVRSIYAEASACEEERERKLRAQHAMRSENVSRLEALIKIAGTQEAIRSVVEEFDRDPFLFNCDNGTLNLRTGNLTPHNPRDMLTQCSPVLFDPNARCPTWEKFLEEVMENNQPLIEFLQRAVGYTLTGNTSEHVFFLNHGGGRNGKGVFMSILQFLLGDYSIASAFSTFETLKANANSPRGDLVDLRGRRLVSASENDPEVQLNEGMIKGLTGGDELVARMLYKENVRFSPVFKLWLYCNNKPVIKGTDEAIWERVLFIPWRRFFKPEERDLKLLDKLKAEASGILNWALAGCLAWQQDGLRIPPEVRGAVAEYRSEMDNVLRFIAGHCKPQRGSRLKSSELYNAYVEACAEDGEKPVSNKLFSGRLAKHGYKKVKDRNANYWEGLTLLSSVVEGVGDVEAESKNSPHEEISGENSVKVLPHPAHLPPKPAEGAGQWQAVCLANPPSNRGAALNSLPLEDADPIPVEESDTPSEPPIAEELFGLDKGQVQP